MKSITVYQSTHKSADIIWEAWMKASPWNHWDQSQQVEKGKKGHVVSKNKKAIPYKILQVEKNKCLTILWKALFVRLLFKYQIENQEKGCIISYTVSFKGFFLGLCIFY